MKTSGLIKVAQYGLKNYQHPVTQLMATLI